MPDRSDMTDNPLPTLSQEERATYEWQMWVRDFGEIGQRRLKKASVMISRVGGLGGVVAYELAAAGVGRLVLAHGGNIKHSDLNRQLLMTHDQLGQSRVVCAAQRLKQLNPRLEVVQVPHNISEDNAAEVVRQADIVVDAAPLFEERYAMNRAAVQQGVPMVECAMHEMEAHITTILPGQSACLACLYPQKPPYWQRKFPVFGAVSGTVGCIAATEVIKIIGQFGEPLAGRLLTMDLRDMTFRSVNTRRDPACPVCSPAAEDNG